MKTENCIFNKQDIQGLLLEMIEMIQPPLEKFTLKTSRLTLRPARPEDLKDIYTLFSNEEVMKYWCVKYTK